MDKLEYAKNLYLRGFSGDLILKQTGFTIIKMHWLLKKRDADVCKKDIVPFQISYIKSNYSADEMEHAYTWILISFKNPSSLVKSHRIKVLGCCFGEYPKVFKSLLGLKTYNKLRNSVWKSKQTNTMLNKYGVTNAFDKKTFHQFVSDDAIERGRKKRANTMISRYGVLNPNSNPVILSKMMSSLRKTNTVRYGVEYVMQNPDVARRSAQARMSSMTERYGAPNSVQIPQIKKKIFKSRKANNQFQSSKPEEDLYIKLCNLFSSDDVLRNYVDEKRYPFHVDFYIKSKDLFIELNGDVSHQDHWFDQSDPSDIARANFYLNKSANSKRYKNIFNTWTKSDVLKRSYAKRFKLNYLVFWKYRRVQYDGHPSFEFEELNRWVNAGFPDSKFFDPKCTY